MRRGPAAAVVAAAAAALALMAVLLADDRVPPRPSASVATALPAVPAETPAASPDAPLPAHRDLLPGFVVSPVELGTYRVSLVFRLRNTILNGLSGEASDYVVETAQARRGSDTGLLVRVNAVPGAAPPDIPHDANRLVGLEPLSRRRVRGRPVTVYRLPGYRLAVVDAGPRQAIVVIASRRRLAEDLAGAVARAASTG